MSSISVANHKKWEGLVPSHFFDCVTRINEPIRLLDWREVRIRLSEIGKLAWQAERVRIFKFASQICRGSPL